MVHPNNPVLGTPLEIIFIGHLIHGGVLRPRCRVRSRIQFQALAITQLHNAISMGEQNELTMHSHYVCEMVFQRISIFSFMPFCSSQISYQKQE